MNGEFRQIPVVCILNYTAVCEPINLHYIKTNEKIGAPRRILSYIKAKNKELLFRLPGIISK
jgi:hypothetical protein